MNAQVKAQWITALRSGEYVQGKNRLRYIVDDTVVHCCLGILCEIRLDVHRVGYRYVYLDSGKFYKGSLDPALLKAIDLPEEDEARLIDLNDADNASFNEMADWIEMYL